MCVPGFNGKMTAALLPLAAFVLYALPALLSPAFGERVESAGFADIGGGFPYGAGYGFSSSYEHNGAAQEAAVSTSASAAFSGRSGMLSFYPQPSPVNDLLLVAVSSYSLRMTWTAPAANWYRGTGTVSRYILRYSSAAPLSTDAAFASAADFAQGWAPLAIGAGDTRVIAGFNTGTTYYFAIESVNDHLLTSERSNIAYVFAMVPLAPMNFRVTAGATSVTMSWIAPAGFANRMPFNDRFNPIYPYEINGYQVFRATAPANADWIPLGLQLSTDTFNFTDNTASASQEYYYHVKAVNRAGSSVPSYTQGSAGRSLYFTAADNASVLEIPEAGRVDFISDSANADPMNFYTVDISSHSGDLAGRVLRSVEFSAYRGGIEKLDHFKLSKPAIVKVYYRVSGGAIVPSAGDPGNISLYYYNGAKWLQLYGKVDTAGSNISLTTSLLGRYQVRASARSVAFSADASGLSNRLITPNGDGKNDSMVFVFDNPMGSPVKGRIYDMKGALVAKMTAGPISNSVVWDAKIGGAAVPGGVYIYQIESGGNVYNGTVAVIK